MKIYIYSLLFILLLPLQLIAQQTVKIINVETSEPVEYVTVSTNNDSVKMLASIDGLINLDLNRTLNYRFTRLGFKDFRITGEELSSQKIVKMELLPVELSPISVSAIAAWIDLNRAVEKTFKAIPQYPFYLKCFQNDKVEENNSNLIDAKAIYASKVNRLFEKGRGCSARTKLKELKVNTNENYKPSSVKWNSFYEIPYVNSFLVGHNKKDDNNLTFYYFDINDSILIIGYNPKLKFNPESYILTSGRFIIDKRDWKLIRIDSDINPRMIKCQNEKALADSKKNIIYQNFNRSIYFSKNGLPTKLYERLEYTLKNDKNKSTWVNTISHIYKEMTERDFEVVPKKKTESKSIIYQKPFYSSAFDSEFEKGLK